MITLRGITWDHERGYGPLLATAEAFMADHPDVEIAWKVRTLQEFGLAPVDELAETYDLLVIDHPFVGFAADDGCLLPLDEYLDSDFLREQAEQSVGKSNASYIYGDHQWALAIDAAAQVSSYRRDLLTDLGRDVPRTWDEVLDLAHVTRQRGSRWIAFPLIPIDAIMSFLSLCANAGEEPGRSPERLVSRKMGRYALEMLQALKSVAHPQSLAWNPIQTYEKMSRTDEIVYCPLAFGYSNYARPGFRDETVLFTNIPSAGAMGSGGAILGGTGYAVSSASPHPEEACAYGAYLAADETQRTIYFEEGGQPGNRVAWTDAGVNQASNNYFLDTLETLDKAYLRPRYNGFIEVQELAGPLIHDFLRNGGDRDRLLDRLDALYRESRDS